MDCPVDAAAQYRQLLQLGRDEFLAAAAPAALIRYNPRGGDDTRSGVHTLTIDQDETFEEASDETRPFCSPRCRDVDLHRWLSGHYVVPGSENDEEEQK